MRLQRERRHLLSSNCLCQKTASIETRYIYMYTELIHMWVLFLILSSFSTHTCAIKMLESLTSLSSHLHNSFFLTPCSSSYEKNEDLPHYLYMRFFPRCIRGIHLRDFCGARFVRFVSEFNSPSIQVNEDFRVMQRETDHNSETGDKGSLGDTTGNLCSLSFCFQNYENCDRNYFLSI